MSRHSLLLLRLYAYTRSLRSKLHLERVVSAYCNFLRRRKQCPGSRKRRPCNGIEDEDESEDITESGAYRFATEAPLTFSKSLTIEASSRFP